MDPALPMKTSPLRLRAWLRPNACLALVRRREHAGMRLSSTDVAALRLGFTPWIRTGRTPTAARYAARAVDDLFDFIGRSDLPLRPRPARLDPCLVPLGVRPTVRGVPVLTRAVDGDGEGGICVGTGVCEFATRLWVAVYGL